MSKMVNAALIDGLVRELEAVVDLVLHPHRTGT